MAPTLHEYCEKNINIQVRHKNCRMIIRQYDDDLKTECRIIWEGIQVKVLLLKNSIIISNKFTDWLKVFRVGVILIVYKFSRIISLIITFSRFEESFS